MLLKSIRMQMHHMLRKRTTVMIYLILCGAVLCNFFMNMNRFKNGDLSQMMSPMKLSSVSIWTVVNYYIMQFYPLLLVIPTAGCYFDEKNSRVCNYIQVKVGASNYLIGKAVSVFLITVILFSVPFLMEIIVYMITVPCAAQGDPSNFQYFQTIETDGKLFWSDLYFFNPYLYTVVCIIIFAVVSGIFAVFNFSLTTLKAFKFRVFTYFPIYILFYSIYIISSFLHIKCETRYGAVLSLFSAPIEANYGLYFLFCIGLLVIAASIIFFKIRKRDIV